MNLQTFINQVLRQVNKNNNEDVHFDIGLGVDEFGEIFICDGSTNRIKFTVQNT